MNTTLRSATAAAALVLGANAYPAPDPSRDLLASFAGDKNVPAFDILASDVTFDSGVGNFFLHAHTAGRIADAANAAFVFGFNRGGITNSPFAEIGVPGVSFNATVLLRSNGTGTVGANGITARVEGDDIFATVSASLLPSNGLPTESFTWALWSVDTAIAGNARNADFAPDSNVRVAAVPEPETYAFMLAGLGLLGAVGRRRQSAFAGRRFTGPLTATV